MSSPGTHASTELPAVDERLIAPESGYEMDDGKAVRVPPCDEPHGTCHVRLAALLSAHIADAFDAAIDMLTRTSETNDLAPDASVFPRARHPRTGGRQLEHLAFEIASTQSLGNAGTKAAKLAGRGVRRVFAIDVERSCVLEWSSVLETWSILDGAGYLEDPTLAVPLPIAALVRATVADEAVASALIARGHPVIEEMRERAHNQGMAHSILVVLRSRSLDPTVEEQARIRGERDPERLERWLAAAALCTTVSGLLAL